MSFYYVTMSLAINIFMVEYISNLCCRAPFYSELYSVIAFVEWSYNDTQVYDTSVIFCFIRLNMLLILYWW